MLKRNFLLLLLRNKKIINTEINPATSPASALVVLRNIISIIINAEVITDNHFHVELSIHTLAREKGKSIRSVSEKKFLFPSVDASVYSILKDSPGETGLFQASIS